MASTGAASPLEITVSYSDRVNFAMYENYVPLVHRLTVRNRSIDALSGIVIALRAEPDLADARELRVALLPAGASFEFETVDLKLSRAKLAGQVERERGGLRVTATAGGEVALDEEHPLEILPFDEWSGSDGLPEILAAFVMRHHPVTERIVADASAELAAATGDGALTAYRAKDPARVRATMAAVYRAVCKLEVSYASPPPDFARKGQRVRTPEQIADTRMANCVDLALLFAACLEKCGLHPLLVLLEDHALCGAWLVDDCFSTAVVHESLLLKKRIDVGLIELFDPTQVTAGSIPPFDECCGQARAQGVDPDQFLMAIDVIGARKNRIRPIPPRTRDETLVLADAEAADPAPATAPVAVEDAPDVEPRPQSRIDVWKQRLLDLSLRNRLLNFRPTKKTVPLLCEDLGMLEDAFAADRTFSIEAETAQLGSDDPREGAVYRERHGEDAEKAIFADWLQAGRLYAKLGAEELERRLVGLYREARVALEESGANTLYLALGFLEWYETPASTVKRRAPILLLPLELTRRSVRSGFRVRLSDDDPRINVTLLKKLAMDFGVEVTGLDELPEDAQGLDVPLILERVRKAVLAFDRWDVAPEAWIGSFSFTKFLMYLDLEKRSELLARNAVIEHLVEHPGEAFAAPPLPRHEDVDAVRSAGETWCPLLADSSQLEAILAAADGRSFVLEGPPGTGKSQTITNLIAHCLAQNKRVLFVSEKMAALEVVQRRLESVGLGDFCLELHSNKAKKKQVIEQLGAALALERADVPASWTETAQRLDEARRSLNEYCSTLHAERPIGQSARAGIAATIACRDVTRVPLAFDLEALDREQVEAMRETVGRLGTGAREVAPVASHPFLPARLCDWDRGVVQTMEVCASEVRALAARAREKRDELAGLVGLEAHDLSETQVRQLVAYGERLALGKAPAAAILQVPNADAVRVRIASWVERGRRRDALRSELFARYDEPLLRSDLETVLAGLRRARATFWPLSWWRARAGRAALAGVARGALGSLEEVIRDVESAIDLRGLEAELAAVAEAEEWLGAEWQDGEPNWVVLERIATHVAALGEALAGVRRSFGAEPRNHLALAVAGPDREPAIHRVDALAAELASTLVDLDAACAQLAVILDSEVARAFGGGDDAGFLERRDQTAGRFLDHADTLRAFTVYNRARRDAVALGLRPLVAATEAGELAEAAIESCFEASFQDWFVGAVLEAEPVLKRFNGVEHRHEIAKFRDLDGAYLASTREVVRARLASRLPKASARDARGEVGTLQRQLKLSRRHMPIRRLFREIPHLLARLKPCFLMSPLSVAQYLDGDLPPFDLVVFDEASQIPVWDAIGAIARGDEVIVVGDSKQLPPTTFFSKTTGELEEADEESLEELESILDECDAARLPKLDLRWHYRSRHESLIAFSNHHYYASGLQSFPSARDVHPEMGVGWRHVEDGVYDRSKTSTNPAEAEAVVAEIAARLRAGDDRSIGVVTFSRAQQTLIEDLVDQLRRDDSELDSLLATASSEPLFVKNLENVQGDERDVILFSICYGPDARGRVFMNFGPLNKPGGERRLNVAITRARQQVVVFSTLRAEQIDLARVGESATGVRHLRSFLEYAERGPDALPCTGEAESAPRARAFEADVRRVLEEHGYMVHECVGRSGYRIDLGVVDPADPGGYLLGVECDGAAYASARSARDRDRLREMVLRGLGWRLHRVWCLDWLYERDREIERLLGAIREPVARTARKAPAPAVAAAAEPGLEEPAAARAHEEYEALGEREPLGIQEDFYEDGETRRVLEIIREVLAVEAPLSLDVLLRRVAPLWQIKRMTSRVQQRIADLLETVGAQQIPEGDRIFLWREDQDPGAYTGFRVPGAERESSDLPAAEIANAALEVLHCSISLERDALIRETARLFGMGVGRRIAEDLGRGIDLLVSRGDARVVGESVVLVE